MRLLQLRNSATATDDHRGLARGGPHATADQVAGALRGRCDHSLDRLSACEAETVGRGESPGKRPMSMEIEVPEGCGPGDAILIEVDGIEVQVEVPEGCESGDTFEIELEESDGDGAGEDEADGMEEAGQDEQDEDRGEDGVEVAESTLVKVTCPDGVQPGDVLAIAVADGLEIDVEIPAGVAVGDTFEVEVELPPSDMLPEPEPEPELEPVSEAADAREDFHQLRVAELRGRLADLGLPTSGRKPDLVARLEEHYGIRSATDDAKQRLGGMKQKNGGSSSGSRRRFSVSTVPGAAEMQDFLQVLGQEEAEEEEAEEEEDPDTLRVICPEVSPLSARTCYAVSSHLLRNLWAIHSTPTH